MKMVVACLFTTNSNVLEYLIYFNCANEALFLMKLTPNIGLINLKY